MAGFEKNVVSKTEQLTVDGVPVEVNYVSESESPVTEQEIRAHLSRGNAQHHGSTVSGLSLTVDGEEVGITYDLSPLPFERIRRITGYLTGDLSSWNSAKRAEEKDRVKHL